MTPPREGLTERQRAEALFVQVMAGVTSNKGIDLIAAALRAAEADALERAAQVVYDEDEGPHGQDYQLGDVSDFRKRCLKAIRALRSSQERSNDEVANVELRVPSTDVDAAGVGGDAPVQLSDEEARRRSTFDAQLAKAGCEPVAPAPSAAEKRIAKLEAVLRASRKHAWDAGCRGYLGNDFFDRIDAALASPGAAGEETHKP